VLTSDSTLDLSLGTSDWFLISATQAYDDSTWTGASFNGGAVYVPDPQAGSWTQIDDQSLTGVLPKN
jgi:hypothetical protein